jgi:thiosulfate reductase cytochrome b subunit
MRKESGYPIWLRIWHWGNAMLFVTLLITGLNMHYSRQAPAPLGFRATVFAHNTAGILLTLFYFFFLYGNARLHNGRYYRLLREDFKPGIVRQIRYYLWGIFVAAAHPYPPACDRKFNPLQKLSYIAAMYLFFPLLAVTGWSLLFPDRLPAMLFGMPGIGVWALIHTGTGYFLSLFMVIHIYLGTTGSTPGQLFRLMWSGNAQSCELSNEREPAPADE